MRIGYFVPEFPGQTHIFFWREMAELQKLGVILEVISTRRPNRILASHVWATEAMAETEYLVPLSATSWARALPALVGIGPTRLARILRLILTEAEPGTRLRLLILLPFALALVRFCRRKRLGHVHVHSSGNAAAVAMLAHLSGGPAYSLTLHGPLADYGPNQTLKWHHAAFAIVITQKLHDELRDRLGLAVASKTRISPMGVDASFFTRQAPYRPWDGVGPVRLFSCGRLNFIKGHQDLIAAVGLLAAQHGLDIHLAIAGEDEEGGQGFRRRLEEQIAQAGLAGRVRLLGAVSEAEVRTQLEACHVFALASHHEPLGVAYMEAMAMALPVVGTRDGGVTELIEDGIDGLLVPPKDPEALAVPIAALLTRPEATVGMGKNAQHKVEAHFGTSGSARTLIDGLHQAG